jgi:hypothetical protein
MAQLVGKLCVVCQKEIGWVGDSRFCRTCKSPVHNACATAAVARAAENQCPHCGAEVRPLAAPGVNAHWLFGPDDQSEAKWLLEWDDAKLVLRKLDGHSGFESDIAYAHRVIEFDKLYSNGQICFSTPQGSLPFEGNKNAVAALREFVAAGIRSDTEYRMHLQRRAMRAIPIGLTMFVVAVSLFALYCWFASWAPDPPPGHWIEWLGGLIRMLLWALLAVAAWGLRMSYLGLQRWRLVKRVRREW